MKNILTIALMLAISPAFGAVAQDSVPQLTGDKKHKIEFKRTDEATKEMSSPEKS